jgi:aspartate 1-decarboxylase
LLSGRAFRIVPVLKTRLCRHGPAGWKELLNAATTRGRPVMQTIMLKSKLHRATVTGAERDYEGSLTIDRALMDSVAMRPYEKILVANIENGERFETYAIEAESCSGTICLNGATAHKGKVGDRLIIFSFALVSEEELRLHRPLILVLDEHNKPVGGVREG